MEDSVRRQGAILGLYWGCFGDKGRQDGQFSIIVSVSFAFQCSHVPHAQRSAIIVVWLRLLQGAAKSGLWNANPRSSLE